MCLLAVYRPGAQPDSEALLRATVRNPDGFGWAIVVESEVMSYRTMDPADAVASFVEHRAAYREGSALFHARFTTHGSTTLYNCHPFPVGDSRRVVVAHNGILPVEPSKGRSDTHEFAAEMLRPGDLDNPAAMYWLARWAEGSKLAVLSADPTTAFDCYIVNEELGTWYGDTWYSNEGWRELPVFGYSANPRIASRFGSYTEQLLAEGVADAWEWYRPGDGVVECSACGEHYPDFVDWCDECGGDLRFSPVCFDDGDFVLGGGE